MARYTRRKFVPPAAEGLPRNALESAANGATMVDAWAEDPNGRNFLAHALVQLARDGWLRRQPDPTKAFDVSDQPRAVPAPLPAPAVDDCCGAEPPSDGSWGDCWCTLPPGHTGEHRCQPCTDRHGAPGWKDDA